MILEWQTELYTNIRKNFVDCHANKPCHLMFLKELDQAGAKIEEFCSDEKYIVTDSLGMNSTRQIRFADEKKYMMFLLKWS